MKGEAAPDMGTRITAIFPTERVVQRDDPAMAVRKTG
jgi:hypothetical protein